MVVPLADFLIVVTCRYYKGSVLSISVGSRPPPFLLFFQASTYTIMFPKVFETTLYTEQITVCPRDLFINPAPPAILDVYQPHTQAEYYTPPIDTVNDNRVSFKFSSSHVTDSQLIMFPKVFETTFPTEQITVYPRDLFTNPPASLSVYQPQSEYTPTIDANCVSLQVFFSSCHLLMAYPRAIYDHDPTMLDSIDFRKRIQPPSQSASAGCM